MNQDSERCDSEIVRLHTVIKGLESTSKLLVKRDIELRRAYDSLKSLDLEKTEFVSIAAHQLRTPVTSARWAISYLQENAVDLNEQQLTLIESARKSIDHIYDLVENLLDLNRIDFGSVNLKLEPTKIEAVCEAVINDHKQIKEHQHIHINRIYAHNTRPVLTDQHRIVDVIDNLVDNAIKYSGSSTTIDISTIYTPHTVKIAVTDRGIGVYKNEEGKIFNKFTRLGNAAQIDPNGTGLGLYISKKIVEKHGGTITYSRNEPRGSIFTVELPC